MLIFISDLHFVDGSAGEHNVPAEAFKVFFEDIAGICDWLGREGRRIEEIKIVFLGDIFDLLRTEMWFQFPVEERPWGSNEKKVEENANLIFDLIVEKNKEVFDLLQSELKGEFGLPVEPERIYIPGNHDRLCNKYRSLREKVCRLLKISTDCNVPFSNYFEDVDYGVFARHGHEFDKFNYEGGISYSYEDYMRVPIGDPITTELVAKLPWKLMNRHEIKEMPQHEQEALKRNFQEIENVRPFSAILEWLLYQVKKNLRIKEVIEDVVDETIREFNELEFVKRWYRHHDKWSDFLDEADKIQAVLFLLEKFKVFSLERMMPLLEKVKKFFEKDELLEAAKKEFSHLDSRIRYIVYGHSHVPEQIPIRIVTRPDNTEVQHIYLNTGTWRTRYYRCKEGLGFIGWKELTYIIFYRKEERNKDLPAFETWTGRLKVR
jgi:UDP-2,3-diacylglucosamine pyrophosphatase LpxH